MADVNLFDLAARITADTSQAERGLTATQQKVLSLAQEFSHLDSKSTQSGKKAAQSVDQIGAAAARASASVDRLNKSVPAWFKGVEGSTLTLKQQFNAVESLQRQRSAAMISAWAQEQRAATKTAQSITNVGAAASKTTQSAGNLRGVFQGLTNATTTLDGPLGGISSRLSSIASIGAGVSSSAGAIGVAIGALAAVSAGAAVGIFKLVSASAEATGHLYDLSQRTNFSVETLSALQHAAETSGGSIETVSSALGIFQRNQEEAASGNEEMARTFKALNIDVHDNEKALRQAFATLSKMQGGAQQTALSMKLFGRSGREVMAIYKEAGGNLDEFISTLRDKGLLVTTDAARKGDQLSDSLTRLNQEFSAISRRVASEFAPAVSQALQDFSSWLIRNQGELVKTAKEVAGVISIVYQLANVIKEIFPLTAVIRVVYQASDWMAKNESQFRSIEEAEAGFRKTGLDEKNARIKAERWWAEKHPYKDAREAVGADWGKRPEPAAPRMRIPGGGSGGGGTKRDSPAAAAQQLLNSLLDEYNRTQAKAQDLTKFEIVQQELLKDKYQGTSKALIDLRQRIQDVATWITIDAQETERINVIKARMKENLERGNRAQEEQINIENMAAEAVQRLRDELNQLQFGQESNQTAAQKFAARIQKMAEETGGMTERTRELIALLQKLGATLDQVTADKASSEKWRKVGEAIGFPDSGDYDRDQRQAAEDRMRQIQDRARDLTMAIDDAIHAGFEGGIKRGFASLASSLLQMINNVLLRQIEEGLTRVLSGINGGAGAGKGGLGAVLGTVLGGLGGIFGGIFGGGGGGSWGKMGGKIGFPTPVKLARGMDFVPFDNFPALLHRGERVVPASENTAGGVRPVVINVYAQDAKSFASRDSKRQITNAYRRELQASALQS